MKNLLEQLYKSEINLQIDWFWDSGFSIRIGDEMNGFDAEFSSDDLQECIEWVEKKAKELYPESEFAKEYKGETFESVARPLMKWMAENQHPHTTTIVRSDTAELVEGLKCIKTGEYIVD